MRTQSEFSFCCFGKKFSSALSCGGKHFSLPSAEERMGLSLLRPGPGSPWSMVVAGVFQWCEVRDL